MSETTLRFKTQAELQALKAYTSGLADARKELEGLTRAAREYNAATGQGGGGGGGGDAAPPSGAGPAGTPGQGAPGHNPPAPPGGGGYAPPSGPGGAPGAPGGGWGGGGGYPGAHSADPFRRARAQVNAYGERYVPPWINRGGGGFLSTMAGTMMGVGLGQSLTGFLLSSGQQYMELSKVAAVLDARFDGAAGAIMRFGRALGYSRAESAALGEALGAQTNVVGEESMSYLGFARSRGLDPRMSMGLLGGISRIMGTKVTGSQLGALHGLARRMGMDQGRMEEFLQSNASLVDLIYGTTGMRFGPSATGGGVFGAGLAAQALPGIVFGNDAPIAQGQMGLGFLNALQGTMTGGGPMESFLMRAMGYGTERGPGYIEMKKRIESGIFGKAGVQNLTDVFGFMQGSGYGREDQFIALESASGGQLKAWQIEALVDSLGTAGGLAKLQKAGSVESYLSGLTGAEQAAAAGGYVAEGKKHISLGEGYALKLEDMKQETGAIVAQAMDDMRDTVVNFAKGFKELFGQDIGKVILDLTESVKKFSEKAAGAGKGYMEWAESVTKGGPDAPAYAPIITAPTEYYTRSIQFFDTVEKWLEGFANTRLGGLLLGPTPGDVGGVQPDYYNTDGGAR